MSKTITKYKFYGVFEYELEEQNLNKASKSGLQLVKTERFRSVFIDDTSVRYIYRLDYNKSITDLIVYREFFAEQGWEYVDSISNGWHYFRKPYVESIDQSQYQIYTDKQSLYEMQNRWLRTILFVSIISCVLAGIFLFFGMQKSYLNYILEGVGFALIAITMGIAFVSTKMKRKNANIKFFIPAKVLFPCITILLVVVVFCGILGIGNYPVIHHENFSVVCYDESQLPKTCGDFEIKDSGLYKVSFEVNIKGGTMIIEIKDQNGKTIFDSIVTDSGKMGNSDLYLDSGLYQIFYTYHLGENFESGTVVKLNLRIRG